MSNGSVELERYPIPTTRIRQGIGGYVVVFLVPFENRKMQGMQKSLLGNILH